MKKIAAFVLLAAIAGCAAPDQLLSRAPDAVYHTPVAPTDVAFCLGDKNASATREMPDGSRQVLVKNMYHGIALGFVIYPEGTGSRVEFRRDKGTFGGVWRQCIGPAAMKP